MDVLDFTSSNGIHVASQFGLGKLNGLCRAAKIGLPVSPHGWLLRTAADVDAVANILRDTIALCRPDAPEGHGSRLPRGRDAVAVDLSAFLERCQRSVDSAVLLTFPHPTYAIAGRYLPRHQTGGAVNILLRLSEEIAIDYVGRGFDVGDITRGKSAHSTLRIEWSDRFAKPSHWLRDARGSGTHWRISASDYAQQRQERIAELVSEFGHTVSEVAIAVPESLPVLSDSILKRVQAEFIDPLLRSAEAGTLPRVSATMANLYDAGSYAFELWIPERSAGPRTP
jgi:hypothetical protein